MQWSEKSPFIFFVELNHRRRLQLPINIKTRPFPTRNFAGNLNLTLVFLNSSSNFKTETKSKALGSNNTTKLHDI